MKKLLQYSEVLKSLPRSGWLDCGIDQPETVAAHSWQMALMAMVLSGTLDEEYDYNKVMKMCLCHDLAESIIGDLTPHDERYCNKSACEQLAMEKISEEADFPEAYWLLKEYEEEKTPEARFTHDLDKIDMYAQALYYEKQYPSKDFSEFKRSAIESIQTRLGALLLQNIEE